MIARRRLSLIAGLALAAVVAGLLAGCEGAPENSSKWLAGQNGIVGTSVVSVTREELSVSGVVRGELRKGISSSDLQTLVDTVGEYQAKHSNITFELGQHDVDFSLAGRATNKHLIALWRTAVRAPKALSGLVSWSGDKYEVELRTLRPDAITALTFIGGLKSDLQLDAYATPGDESKGDDHVLRFFVPAGCSPSDADWAFAKTVPGRADIGGGMLDLCASLQLDGVENAPLASLAGPLRAELEKGGVTLPTTLVSNYLGTAWSRSIAVLPGNPAAFPTAAAIEPSAARYQVAEDGTLTVTDRDHPVDSLVSLVSAAPGAAALPEIDLYGSDAAVGGPLGALPGLRTTALALDASSDTFDRVQLTPYNGSVQLDGTISDPPDVKTAATVLKASGVTQGRKFTVIYVSMSVDIVDGVAKVHDTYTQPEIVQGFADAWNALS